MHVAPRHPAVALGAAITALALAGSGLGPATAAGTRHYTTKTPTSTGYGGAVTSVDPEASRIGIRVLKHGGNAVDAAVATAAALGVTEPYSAGIGGGGYFVYYDAKTKRVHTIDGRETAPDSMKRDAFIDPKTGKPYNFTPELVTSGVSIGVPGTAKTWSKATRLWGTRSFAQALEPARRLARRGFVVDQTFHDQTADNQERFEAYTTTPKLFLPGGKPPKVGSVFKNPDLAATYRRLQDRGVQWFYSGHLAKEIAVATRRPPKSPSTDLPVPKGSMHKRDLEGYRALKQKPTHSDYRGYDVYGMAPSSSGGSTVGESLDIMEQYRLRGMDVGAALHHYLEATALAFADRAAYVGDRRFVDVPLKDLLSDEYATRARLRDQRDDGDDQAGRGRRRHVVRRQVFRLRLDLGGQGRRHRERRDHQPHRHRQVGQRRGVHPHHRADRGLGAAAEGPRLPAQQRADRLLGRSTTRRTRTGSSRGKRPRSSMSPTILLKNGKPFLALGSPGGSTIITTVTQLLFNRIDRQMKLEDAIAEPRASQRNTEKVFAEPEFIDRYAALLTPYGHSFQQSGDQFTSAAEIGAATAVEFGPRGLLTAVSEPTRRGGGSALVVSSSPAG